jgi:hypothetical protein
MANLRNENEELKSEILKLKSDFEKIFALNEKHKKEILDGNVGIQQYKVAVQKNVSIEANRIKAEFEASKVELFTRMALKDNEIEVLKREVRTFSLLT